MEEGKTESLDVGVWMTLLKLSRRIFWEGVQSHLRSIQLGGQGSKVRICTLHFPYPLIKVHPMGHLHGHRAEFQSTPPLGINLEFPVDGMGQVLLLCACLKMLEDDTGWLCSKGEKKQWWGWKNLKWLIQSVEAVFKQTGLSNGIQKGP